MESTLSLPSPVLFCRKQRMMEYHVTCSKCHRVFTITAEGGDSMHCTCPYCGQGLHVNLPAVAQPVVSPVVQPAAGREDKPGGGIWLKILVTVLTVLVVGGLGIFGFAVWQDRQEAAEQEIRLQRKAHADSLMQIRAQQDAQAREDQRREKQRQAVCSFLLSFYRQAVFTTDDDPSYYARYLTPYCRQMIFGVDPGDGAEDRWESWWAAFGNFNNEYDFEELSRNLRITPVDDNWYKVRLSEHGLTETRTIRVKVSDGHILIDDVR